MDVPMIAVRLPRKLASDLLQTLSPRIAVARLAFALLLALLVAPSQAQAWWDEAWTARKELSVDTSATGHALAGELDEFPVLVRLHEGVLDFTQVAADGSDLRFVAADDLTPLTFHVEKFDSIFNLGFVWVQVPKLVPGQTQKIWMYYGNPAAPNGSQPQKTWDASQVAVLHFGERGTPASDATVNANNALSASGSVESALIGTGARHEGRVGIAIAASPSLATTPGDRRTWTMWAKSSAATQDAVLFTQRDAAADLTIGLAGGLPYVATGALRATATAALDTTGWHHIAAVADGAALTLYVDGASVATVAAALPALSGAGVIAAISAQPGTGSGTGIQAYSGELDELTIARVARDAAWIATAAINQGTADTLVKFGLDEGGGAGEGGHFAVIVQSVTIDAWVVIGLCALMAVYSWYVMWSKGQQLGRVTRGNAVFLDLFGKAAGDFDGLRQRLADSEGRKAQGAPLTDLFAVGLEQVRQRLDAAALRGEAKPVLSDQSIAAIRAALEAQLNRESQSLNRLIVMLTIAISGGPFLGLLGTVVGVMITFASIAAAGDVNVNAIAPGISAALLATVAGLAVAIPALFGYNYLLTRIKDATNEMAVFLDAYVTRIAETYS
jgi:biopolymer transport protein ExbB